LIDNLYYKDSKELMIRIPESRWVKMEIRISARFQAAVIFPPTELSID